MKRENKLNLLGYELTMNAVRSMCFWVALGTPEPLFTVGMIFASGIYYLFILSFQKMKKLNVKYPLGPWKVTSTQIPGLVIDILENSGHIILW